MAKIAAEKGLDFDFANNAKIKESGFAIDGVAVNGVKTGNKIILNMDGRNAIRATVGHEITHVLEGSELYAPLAEAVKSYAITKGEYDSRLEKVTELYRVDPDADPVKELTADLVGEYLFEADEGFINHLLQSDRNVFQKVWDEVKYLCKMATAGSKEARQLLKAQKAFEKAWKAGGQTAQNSTEVDSDTDTQYSISETTDGRFAAVVDSDILAKIDTTSWDKTKKEEAKKAASKALKQFSDGIVVDGITRKVNKTSRDEYTRSNYTEKLYRESPDVFADKMRAAEVADDIVIAATNWSRDGGLSTQGMTILLTLTTVKH